MRTELMNYIRAGYSGIYVISGEETRFEAEAKSVAEELGQTLLAWSATDGLVNSTDGTIRDCRDPLEMLQVIDDLPQNSIVLLRDFHVFLEDPDPFLLRLMRDALRGGKTSGRVLIVCGCRLVLPPELEHDIVTLEFSLPGSEALGVILDGIAESAEQEKTTGDLRGQLLDAASGLSSVEAEDAFALSVVETGALSVTVVAREKARAVKKNGLLEICPAPGSLEDIGGLDLLKGWLNQRHSAFGAAAAEYGLPSPKGLMIIGIPGTGKSLTAKATAGVFQLPLLKLDAGRLYGSLVGQSESNLRSAIQTVEAIAPCVLWIDEVEKAFSGSKSSGSTDGGTASRVFGTFLSWMQDKKAPVFVVATANDVSQLPPELLRKGRFDEIFFADLPNAEEREAIWQIQVRKYGREPEALNVESLVTGSDGFTGSEIEQAFVDSLYTAFAGSREPTDEDVTQALSSTVPLSRLMADQLDGLRRWAQGRTRPATTQNTTQPKRHLQY